MMALTPAPSTAAGTLATDIRARLGELTPTERRAAHVLLSNYPFAGLETVAQFASRAGVSAPSILRFIARLGFSAYADFQRRLKEELEAQLQSPLMKQAPAARSASPLADFANAVIANITQTFDAIAPAEFEAILALICDTKRRIHVVGGRLTEAIALYAVRHLRVIRPDVVLIEGQAATWRDQVIDFGRRDVLIVFDIRRYQEDVVMLAEEAAERSSTIVLFTDQWLSPIARLAKHVISARITVPSNWDSNAALFSVVEAFVAGATKTMWEMAEARMNALEELRKKTR
ncbi:MurR/RpiR family transcriptional regulator [Labrys wisconsinensis]|uniref:DNA-binding MurR/RpiR family transcriptional regulator n=1 Tax=Labrys wisconsinensis TaxID=425677 RepID=A0ABU0J954_9HYPH|nr:MurR/RpiR family transcriptional regulator [Labrys wisconsinensis]MDQ0470794.1 DNA-binding MurR/RpiR family transcriptional regulator [Labrys wisconsinensis]